MTGAANGVGLGICRALARAGANVALADIETQALEHASAPGSALCCYAQYRLAIPAELAHMLGPSFS